MKPFVEKSLNELVKKWGILKENTACWDKTYSDRRVFYRRLVFIDELYWRETTSHYIYIKGAECQLPLQYTYV